MSKYNNKKTVIDGIKFDSKKEARRYLELKELQKQGEISNLKLQPTFILQDKFRKGGKAWRAIKYIADFSYYDKNGNSIIEDVKGIKTDVFKIKQKLFEYKYDNYKLLIT